MVMDLLQTPCVEGGSCQNGTCISYCEKLGKKSCMCEKGMISFDIFVSTGVLSND